MTTTLVHRMDVKRSLAPVFTPPSYAMTAIHARKTLVMSWAAVSSRPSLAMTATLAPTIHAIPLRAIV